jgi:hypothetical protein
VQTSTTNIELDGFCRFFMDFPINNMSIKILETLEVLNLKGNWITFF